MGKQQATITISFKTDSGKAIKDAEKYLALLKDIQRQKPGSSLPFMTYYPTRNTMTPQEMRRAVDAGRLREGKRLRQYELNQRRQAFFSKLESGAISMRDAEIYNPVKLKMFRKQREDYLKSWGFGDAAERRSLAGLDAAQYNAFVKEAMRNQWNRAYLQKTIEKYVNAGPTTPQVSRDQLTDKQLGRHLKLFNAKSGWGFFHNFLGLDAKTTNMFRQRYGQGGIANVMWTAWKERVGLTKDYQKTDIFSQAKTWGGLKQAFSNVGNMFKRLGSMGMNLIKNMFNGFLGIGKTVFSALGVGALASMAGVVAYLKKAVDYSAQLEQGWVQVKAAAGGNSTAIGNYKAYMDEAALNEGVMPEMYQAMARQYELENRVLNSTEKDKRIRELWAPLARATRMTDGRSASALISGGTGIMKTLNMTSYADEQRIQGMLGALYSNTGLASNPEQWNQFIKGLPRVIGGFKGIISPEEVASVAATLSSFFGEKAGTDVRSVLGMLAGFTKNEGIQNAARFLTGDSKITALGFLKQEQARDPKHGLMNALKRMQDLSIVAEEKGWDEFRFDKMFGYQGGKLTANEILNLSSDQRRVQEDLLNGQQVTRDMIADHKNTYEGKLEEVRSAGADIKNKIGEAIINWLEPYLPLIKQKATLVATFFDEHGAEITEWLTKTTDHIISWWKDHGPDLWNDMVTIKDAVLAIAEKILGPKEAAKAIGDAIGASKRNDLNWHQARMYQAMKQGNEKDYLRARTEFNQKYKSLSTEQRKPFEDYYNQVNEKSFDQLSKWANSSIGMRNYVFDPNIKSNRLTHHQKRALPLPEGKVDLSKMPQMKLGPQMTSQQVIKNTLHITIEGNADEDVMRKAAQQIFDATTNPKYGSYLPAM